MNLCTARPVERPVAELRVEPGALSRAWSATVHLPWWPPVAGVEDFTYLAYSCGKPPGGAEFHTVVGCTGVQIPYYVC